MNFPDDETGQVLAEMQQAGIDLSKHHDIVFFNLFESQESAQKMVDFVGETMPNVNVKLVPDETPNVWDIDCTLSMLPSYDNIVEQEAEFEKVAGKFNGYNDGWGIEA